MIYRVLCNGSDGNAIFLDIWNKAEAQAAARERLMGVYAADVPGDWAGLRRPHIACRRARFYFTEKGWRLFGRFIAAAARRDGRVVRVLRRKNPMPSEVVYEDELQVAVLPRKGVPRKRRK